MNTDAKMTPHHIVLLGPPGAGKSSLGRRLARDFNLMYIATGDIFRDAVTEERLWDDGWRCTCKRGS